MAGTQGLEFKRDAGLAQTIEEIRPQSAPAVRVLAIDAGTALDRTVGEGGDAA